MPKITFFRLQKVFQFYLLWFLFTLLLQLHVATNSTNHETLKSKFRPLKYSGKCDELCKNITCQPVETCKAENGEWIIEKKGSYCGCCDVCVKVIEIGQSCKITKVKGSLDLGSGSRCKNGSVCSDNGICELDKEIKGCLLNADIRKKHIERGTYSDIWIPQCDAEGKYIAKQKKISRSFCVDESGNTIFGSADDFLENSCACSRHMHAKSILRSWTTADSIPYVKAEEHCSHSGSFNQLQCIGNLCYCADENTGEIRSELVRMDYLDILECDNDAEKESRDTRRKSYLTECEIELQRSRKLTQDFLKKGVRIYGLDKIKCDLDGTYSPTQCIPERCYCTNLEGMQIRDYNEVTAKISSVDMLCNCARDDYSSHYMPYSCEKHGNYEPLSRIDEKYVCVDKDGEAIVTELKDPNPTKELCENKIEKLLEYPEETETTDETNEEDKSTSDYIYDDNSYNN